ncbi:MAG: hypothetical protein HQM12_08755 [SAR324 cluster bacterium]|nr:hypothetical protein [SAR324 cluster bacterium]MBF0351807.1 hypothetical protein [SAR324 cluster bacterium]
MRILLVSCSCFLGISGILLRSPEIFPWKAVVSGLEITHNWGGMLFLVIFPMYSLDHLRIHQKRLKAISLVSVSGFAQLFSGLGLIISGIAVFLYGTDPQSFSTQSHYLLTYLLVVSMMMHYIIKK